MNNEKMATDALGFYIPLNEEMVKVNNKYRWIRSLVEFDGHVGLLYSMFRAAYLVETLYAKCIYENMCNEDFIRTMSLVNFVIHNFDMVVKTDGINHVGIPADVIDEFRSERLGEKIEEFNKNMNEGEMHCYYNMCRILLALSKKIEYYSIE